VLGDSISTGRNTSEWGDGVPYQPAYPELVRRHLEKRYRGVVRPANLPVSDKDTLWALTMVYLVVESRPVSSSSRSG
jgi:hypothetical protein